MLPRCHRGWEGLYMMDVSLTNILPSPTFTVESRKHPRIEPAHITSLFIFFLSFSELPEPNIVQNTADATTVSLKFLNSGLHTPKDLKLLRRWRLILAFLYKAFVFVYHLYLYQFVIEVNTNYLLVDTALNSSPWMYTDSVQCHLMADVVTPAGWRCEVLLFLTCCERRWECEKGATDVLGALEKEKGLWSRAVMSGLWWVGPDVIADAKTNLLKKSFQFLCPFPVTRFWAPAAVLIIYWYCFKTPPILSSIILPKFKHAIIQICLYAWEFRFPLLDLRCPNQICSSIIIPLCTK